VHAEAASVAAVLAVLLAKADEVSESLPDVTGARAVHR